MSDNLRRALLIASSIIISLVVPIAVWKGPLFIGPAVILALVGLMVLFLTLARFYLGVIFLFFYASMMSVLDRFVVDLPYGVGFEVYMVVVFLAMLIQHKGIKEFDWGNRNPIVILLLILFGYIFLQIGNPYGTIKGSLAGARFDVNFFLFFIFIHWITDYRQLKTFIYTWLSIAMLAALYGIFQELHGFTSWEQQWLNSNPEARALIFISGVWRRFSFLNDPAVFGIMCAISANVVMILLIGPFSKFMKMIAGISFLLLMWCVFISGTRTAFAIFVVGMVFFVLLSLHNRKLIIASSLLILLGLVVYFGPFYSYPVIRFRSTFEGSDDPSMNVRDMARTRMQPYVLSHPFGGGINTVSYRGLDYAPGHPNAGAHLQTDSGYLRTALETGSIGLLILLSLNSAVIIVGVRNYFVIKSPKVRTINLALVTCFFGLSVGNFTQEALFSQPINIVYFGILAIMVNIRAIDKKLENR